jgi:hypothetical protein
MKLPFSNSMLCKPRMFLVSVVALASFIGSANAANLGNVLSVSESKLKVAQASQAKIDELSDERRQLYNEYKAVNKEIEGLQIYNKQLNKQIVTQRQDMETIRNTIEGIAVMARQITPLMLRMVEGLKQFVTLDMPFLQSERQARVTRLEALMDDANITVAEKFRAVLQAYQIEGEYGSTIETYTDTLTIDEEDRKVEILRMGRISMIYQTPDQKYSGFWNQDTKSWEEAGGSANRNNFSTGLKIAKKQVAPDLVILPVKAPEAAQ